jgi:hypothetical protein
MLNNPEYHIDVHDAKAVEYYSRHFYCTPDELIGAVRKIGTSIEEVRIFIQHTGYSARYGIERVVTVNKS